MSWDSSAVIDARIEVIRQIVTCKSDLNNVTCLRTCKQSIDKWFFYFKLCEKTDTFECSLREKRMTVRAVSSKNEILNFSVPNAENDEEKMSLNTGLQGIVARMDPSNFVDRGKYGLGLHTLAASLLRPGMKISEQLFRIRDFLIFMPLPPQFDLDVQIQMSGLAHTLCSIDNPSAAARSLIDSVRNVRRNMTRIHLANELDMSAGFWNFAKKGDAQKFKYGYGKERAQRGQRPMDIDKTDAWRETVTEYQDTVNKNIFARNNEVTIKYRNHWGNFPIITKTKKGIFYPKKYKWKEIKGILGFNKKRTVTDDGKIQG